MLAVKCEKQQIKIYNKSRRIIENHSHPFFYALLAYVRLWAVSLDGRREQRLQMTVSNQCMFRHN